MYQHIQCDQFCDLLYVSIDVNSIAIKSLHGNPNIYHFFISVRITDSNRWYRAMIDLGRMHTHFYVSKFVCHSFRTFWELLCSHFVVQIKIYNAFWDTKYIKRLYQITSGMEYIEHKNLKQQTQLYGHVQVYYIYGHVQLWTCSTLNTFL